MLENLPESTDGYIIAIAEVQKLTKAAIDEIQDLQLRQARKLLIRSMNHNSYSSVFRALELGVDLLSALLPRN